MRTLALAFSLLAIFALPLAARAADGASIQAVLIIASKEKAPADPRLAPYEATLQRNLPESSFRYGGEASASLSGNNATAKISLGSSHQLELKAGGRTAEGISISVQWMNGKDLVMKNSFTVQPGAHFVLVRRPSSDGEVPIIILIAK
jgi:hypothetical protein